MAEPVSWLLIRPGWRVVAADGSPVGEVDEVAGDETQDIFDGLSVATGALAKPRYVPAEQVAEIVEGEVRLALTREQVEALDEYLEPATSAQIEPESSTGVGERLTGELRGLEADVVAPIQRREHSLTLLQRVAHFVRRRLASRTNGPT
jgi:hypothetical protein